MHVAWGTTPLEVGHSPLETWVAWKTRTLPSGNKSLTVSTLEWCWKTPGKWHGSRPLQESETKRRRNEYYFEISLCFLNCGNCIFMVLTKFFTVGLVRHAKPSVNKTETARVWFSINCLDSVPSSTETVHSGPFPCRLSLHALGFHLQSKFAKKPKMQLHTGQLHNDWTNYDNPTARPK